MPHNKSKCIFLAPAPRVVSDIFDENDLLRLCAVGDVVIHEDGAVTDAIFEDSAAKAEIVIGQIDLPELRLKQPRRSGQCSMWRAIFFPTLITPTAFDTVYASLI